MGTLNEQTLLLQKQSGVSNNPLIASFQNVDICAERMAYGIP